MSCRSIPVDIRVQRGQRCSGGRAKCQEDPSHHSFQACFDLFDRTGSNNDSGDPAVGKEPGLAAAVEPWGRSFKKSGFTTITQPVRRGFQSS
jgi:hypothetical protein